VADVIQNNTYYLKDYDIGDLCSISFDEIEQTFKARIMEVNETYSKNQLGIKVIFGTPRKAKYIPVNM
ncbi:Gp37-like protein, partial [Mogibacterium timidum]|uniref:Gp37-like protein n=1 Tax=Mogibacterium timidum TaxID=35519 RepID=UPI002ED07809